jgi:hypothetical protein
MDDIKNIQKTNQNNWKFLIKNGNLTIQNQDNTIKSVYPFSGIIFNETGIYNKTTNQLLNKDIDNLKYPYVIEVDQKLPIFRIYDQNKTLLQEYSSLGPTIPYSLDNITCPDYTFALADDCVIQCPLLYYYYMNGKKGKCTLSPFANSSFINDRTLSNNSNENYNYSNINRGCPYLSTNYTYGCYCLNNAFFDLKKWICVQSKL